jgi:hypothetical protein
MECFEVFAKPSNGAAAAAAAANSRLKSDLIGQFFISGSFPNFVLIIPL